MFNQNCCFPLQAKDNEIAILQYESIELSHPNVSAWLIHLPVFDLL